jgi:uncharacterized protein YgiM (DUF1202 family)
MNSRCAISHAGPFRVLAARLCVSIVVMAALAGVAGAAETVYVKVGNVKVRAGAGLSASDAAAVCYASFKTPLDVLGRDDTWIKVKTPDGQTGWVDEEDVSKDKPKSESKEEIKLAGVKGPVRTEGIAAVRGALPEVEAAAAKYPGKYDTHAVDRMKTFTPSPAEVDGFMEDGGLGRRPKGGR